MPWNQVVKTSGLTFACNRSIVVCHICFAFIALTPSGDTVAVKKLKNSTYKKSYIGIVWWRIVMVALNQNAVKPLFGRKIENYVIGFSSGFQYTERDAMR